MCVGARGMDCIISSHLQRRNFAESIKIDLHDIILIDLHT